jgi:hypothetical protein
MIVTARITICGATARDSVTTGEHKVRPYRTFLSPVVDQCAAADSEIGDKPRGLYAASGDNDTDLSSLERID